MPVLVKKLIDPTNGESFYVFYERENLRRPIMILDSTEFEQIEDAFEREVHKR